MNSGGAHCLKYGVTINNLLGVRLVTLDGDILDLGGAELDAAGLDLLGLVCGSEGQLGIVDRGDDETPARGRGRAPGAVRLRAAEDASRCVAAIIGAGIVPVAMEYMDRPAIAICENFAHAGYPLDVEAMLIVEVEGGDAEMAAELAASPRSPGRTMCASCANRCRRWRARRSGRAASPPSARPAASPTTSAWTARCRPGGCPRR